MSPVRKRTQTTAHTHHSARGSATRRQTHPLGQVAAFDAEGVIDERALAAEVRRLNRVLRQPAARAQIKAHVDAGTLPALTEVALFRLAYGAPPEMD